MDFENLGRISEVAEPPPQQEAAHKGGDEKQMAPATRAIFVRDNITTAYIPGIVVINMNVAYSLTIGSSVSGSTDSPRG